MTEITRVSDFIFIILTIIFTAYAQIVMKWQSPKLLEFPVDNMERIRFLIALIFNPWILSVLVAAFLSMICWMFALSRFRLNFAYPFYSLIFVVVIILAAILFQETITIYKFIGIVFIVMGVIFIGQG